MTDIFRKSLEKYKQKGFSIEYIVYSLWTVGGRFYVRFI